MNFLEKLESIERKLISVSCSKKWDNELAKFAETNVRSCQFDHDKCRNTGIARRSI